jgi:hypothetical protein
VTKIIVTPIDNSAPGSYRERRNLLRAFADVTKASAVENGSDLAALLDARERLDAIVIAHAETEDGTSLDEALDEISGDDFSALLTAILSGETVPNPSASD